MEDVLLSGKLESETLEPARDLGPGYRPVRPHLDGLQDFATLRPIAGPQNGVLRPLHSTTHECDEEARGAD